MAQIKLILVFCLALFVPFTLATTSSGSSATTTTTTTASTTTYNTSTFVSKVTALVKAGTCASVVNGSVCGSATIPYAYYNSFVYNNTYRVTITAGVPNHAAEYNQTKVNPNTRCLRYQYMVTRYTPSKIYNYNATTASAFMASPMGVMGILTSGAPIYNPLSESNGSLASYYEWSTLDPCYGHSDASDQYHYHAISSCIANATTASTNTLIGYHIDGYPIYGYAQVNGVTLKSCWYSTSSTPKLMSDFTYNTTGYNKGTCQLDYANGYTFSSGYGYVMTSANYYAPYYYAGLNMGYVCGFTP